MSKLVNKLMRKLPIITAAFLILVNMIVLAGVNYNRTGETNANLQLTERELSLPYRSYRQKENSGLALKLNWGIVPAKLFTNNYRKYTLSSYGTPNWLTKDKLKELGIFIDSTKIDINVAVFDNRKLPAEAFIIVLEYNGKTFQTLLSKAEKDIQKLRNTVEKNQDDSDLIRQLKRGEESLTQLKTSESRLIAIDAGRNLQTLQEKYPDRSRYLMMRGELRRYWENRKLSARINKLFISNIHLPLPYSEEVNKITNRETSTNRNTKWKGEPRYRFELNVGQRLEPWVGEAGGL